MLSINLRGGLELGRGLAAADHGIEPRSEAAEEPDGRALRRAVYAGSTPVGFVMVSDEVGSADYIPHYGFKRTGEIVFDDEILLRLELR